MRTETAVEQANSLIRKHAQELRDTWQARLLAEAEGREFAVALAVICLEWPTALPTLMRTVFPGFVDITRPFFAGYARTQIDGSVWCGLIDRDYEWRYIRVYTSEHDYVTAFRVIADKLKLNDDDRTMMFKVLRNWITSDMRIDEYGRRKLH